MVGGWGFITFQASGSNGETLTYDKLSDVDTTRYAEHKIIQGISILEFSGEELITVSLTIGLLSPYTVDPAAAIAELKLQKSLHTPLPLILGDAIVGRDLVTLFVMTELKTNYQRFNGAIAVETNTTCSFKEASSFGISDIISAFGG